MAGQDRRHRLVADADRVRRYMVAVIADARRAEVEVPLGVTASVETWRPGPIGWQSPSSRPDEGLEVDHLQALSFVGGLVDHAAQLDEPQEGCQIFYHG
jgi:hypothetical protein